MVTRHPALADLYQNLVEQYKQTADSLNKDSEQVVDTSELKQALQQFQHGVQTHVLHNLGRALQRSSRFYLHDEHLNNDNLHIVREAEQPQVVVDVHVDHTFRSEERLVNALLGADQLYNDTPYHVVKAQVLDMGHGQHKRSKLALMLDPELYRELGEGEQPEQRGDVDLTSLEPDPLEAVVDAADEATDSSEATAGAGETTKPTETTMADDNKPNETPTSETPHAPAPGATIITDTDAQAQQAALDTGRPARAADAGDAANGPGSTTITNTTEPQPTQEQIDQAKDAEQASIHQQEVIQQAREDIAAAAPNAGKVLTEEEALQKLNDDANAEPVATTTIAAQTADPASSDPATPSDTTTEELIKKADPDVAKAQAQLADAAESDTPVEATQADLADIGADSDTPNDNKTGNSRPTKTFRK